MFTHFITFKESVNKSGRLETVGRVPCNKMKSFYLLDLINFFNLSIQFMMDSV